MTEAAYARALQIDGAKCNIRFWRNMGDDTKAESWRRRLAQLTGTAPAYVHPMTLAKDENRDAILAAIKGRVTIKHIEDVTGLSRSTVYTATSELLSAGRVDVVYRGNARYWFRVGGA